MLPPELGGGLDPWGLGPLGLLYVEALVIALASGLGALLNRLCPRCD